MDFESLNPMNPIKTQFYNSPYGELVLGAFDGRLCLCDWRYRKMRSAVDNRLTWGLRAGFIEAEDAVLDRTRRQLEEYFDGKRKIFDIPLLMVGTDFQKRVWKELRLVPYGSAITYLELAERIGNRQALRAVAAANGANAISIIVPCHRIIGSEVLAHPKLVEAIETQFVPVLVYNNRSDGMDKDLLDRYGEPAWNFQVIRFLDAGGMDVIPRKDRIWTTKGVARRMIEALTAVNRPVPRYLEALAGGDDVAS